MGAFPELNELVAKLKPILDKVAIANEKQNRADGHHCPKESVLLPMAFAEGSPSQLWARTRCCGGRVFEDVESVLRFGACDR